MAIDNVNTYYVSYENLASSSNQAEKQKDIILFVLKKALFANGLFQEASKDNENNYKSYFKIKCVLCSSSAFLQTELDPKNLQIITGTNKKINVSFDFQDSDNVMTKWKLEIDEVKPFLVHSGQNVKILFYSQGEVFIEGNGKALKNATLNESIKVQTENYFKNKPNSFNNNKEIIEAHVTGPNEVEYVGR